MTTAFVAFLRLLAEAFGVALPSGGHPGLALFALGALALAGAVVVAVVALGRLVGAVAGAAEGRLRQAADPAELDAQSDPDAPGRPRPRAPGVLRPLA